MSDSKLVRGFQARLLELPEGLLVAVLYAAACWASRQVSLDQFVLQAGVRVAALLVCRREMWPYLMVGEYAYFAFLRVPMLGKYGLEWALLSSAYQFPCVAAIVHTHRRAIENKTDAWLLSVAAAAAVLVGVGNLALAHALWPAQPAGGFMTIASRYVLGHYVGILTVAPLALIWLRRQEIDWSSWRSPVASYAAASLLAVGAVSLLLSSDSQVEKTLAQLVMAIPVVALTCVQGWWGAAIGLPVMSIFVRISTPVTGLPASFDLESFKVQLLMAVAGSALLALGSKITHYYRKCSLQARDQRQAISNARASQSTSERELRSRVVSLRKIGDGLDAALSETVDWLRLQGHHEVATSLLHVATVHSRKFREQANMVYPTTMEHVGLYLAIQIGGIGDTWSNPTDWFSPTWWATRAGSAWTFS